MSRYAVNKFMWLVNMHPGSLAAYKADPVAYVEAWQAGAVSGADVARDAPAGADLSDDEVRALAARDFGALYAAGAHPYLLWSFTEAVWTPEVPRPELVEQFRAAATAAGYPDIRTTRYGP
jgi:hypothetical protein